MLSILSFEKNDLPFNKLSILAYDYNLLPISSFNLIPKFPFFLFLTYFAPIIDSVINSRWIKLIN